MAAADKLAKFMARMQGATGVNSAFLQKVARSGLIDLDTATADDVYRVASQLASQRPARQLELPIGPEAAEPDIRALLPRAAKPSLGVPKAKPDAPVYDAGGIPAAARIDTLFPADKPLPAPRPQQEAPARIAEQFDRATGRGKPDYGPWKEAVGAVTGAGLVGGAAQYMKNDGVATAPAPEMTSTGGTADLVNESRPAPAVAPSEDDERAFTDTFKRQYTAREDKRKAKGMGGYAPQPASDPRAEAQALMADLNDRRRKAGGEVSDAQQTTARINELLSKSNQQRNSRSPSEASAYAKSNPSDYHAQAQALIAQLNDMRRQAGGEVPQAQQMMSEARRLQAMGDRARNAAQTGRY